MSEIKCKNQILAAIDHLRSRKSRPDINRICKFMLKCYKVTPKDTKADLKRCLTEKSVYEVFYKDNVSYRNAAKWRKTSNTVQHNIMSASVASSERRIITSAIATLIYQDQSCLENGIAFDALVQVAASQESNYSKQQLETIINKELLSGSLVKLPNETLALGAAGHDGDSCESFKFPDMDCNKKMNSSGPSSCKSSPQRTRGRPKKSSGGGTLCDSGNSHSNMQNAGVRVGERRKMAKNVFDLSAHNVPSKRKRGRPLGSMNKSTIRKRQLEAEQQEKDKENIPLSESQQSFGGNGDDMEHEEPLPIERSGVCPVCLLQKTSCLREGSGIVKPRPDNTWQCPHCKRCVACSETIDASTLAVCSICTDAYHSLCHSPPTPERLKSWDQWECNHCLESQPTVVGSLAIIPTPIYYNTIGTPTDPFLKPHELDTAPTKSTDVPVDPNIPVISNWNVDDVHNYFTEHLPEAAPILREQEFDGQALSMARRADIVRALGLPLGPALALYRIIVKLQTRKDDWTMCWG